MSHVDKVFWISSLREEEEGVGKRMVEDLESYFNRIDLRFEKHYPKSIQDLFNLLEDTAAASVCDRDPIIHFDMHGQKDKGLFLARCDHFVSWETLTVKLQKVNAMTGNNLTVVLATCFGYNLIRHLDLSNPSPFYMLIAPEKIVSAGFLEDNIPAFYEEVFNTSNPLEAYKNHLASQMRMLHSEEMLAYILIRYFRSSCIGKAGEDRKERLLTEVMQSGRAANIKSNRRMLRKSLKMQIRPNQSIVDRYISTFLMGKKVSYRLDDLMRSARHPPKASNYHTVPFEQD